MILFSSRTNIRPEHDDTTNFRLKNREEKKEDKMNLYSKVRWRIRQIGTIILNCIVNVYYFLCLSNYLRYKVRSFLLVLWCDSLCNVYWMLGRDISYINDVT